MKPVDENTSNEECKRLFRSARNARRAERRQTELAKEPEPEPDTLIAIVDDLLDILADMTNDQPKMNHRICILRGRIQELRYS